MNKESIYNIIGYNGEYNANVKKAIRKLLKENHPDNHGNRKIFELINEVKDELENNKVSYHREKKSGSNTNDSIDYNYCYEMVNKIIKEKNIYLKKQQELQKKQEEYNRHYKENYRKSVNLETYLLSNSQSAEKLKRIKFWSIFILVLTIIVFLISIWNDSLIFFILFTFLVIACIIIIQRSFYVMHEITENNRRKLNSYVGVNSKLRDYVLDQQNLKKEMNEINKVINSLENDLRFYDNILNNR